MSVQQASKRGRAGLDERGWRRLLDEVEYRKVAVVVGPGLLTVEVDGVERLLDETLAGALAERLEIKDEDLPSPLRVNAVAEVYRAAGGQRTDVYYALGEVHSKASWVVPEALRLLAEVRHFDVFVALTGEGLVKRSLDQVRFGGVDRTRHLAYTLKKEIKDLPRDYRPSSDVPLVFEMFGHVSYWPDEYVLTEDDLLAFVGRLQQPEREPAAMLDLLRDRHLLLLGCRFPNWLMRFFLCCAKGDLVVAGGELRGLVADAQGARDPNLNDFLSRRRTRIYDAGDARAFVRELHRRAKERWGDQAATAPQKEREPLPPQPADAVFISYASEDLEAAERLANTLEAAGVEVWFDKRELKAGDKYEHKIYRKIDRCSFFVPVISRHTLGVESRFFRKEWNYAIKEVMRSRPLDAPFLIPVVIDNTSHEAEHIPPEFKDSHCVQIPNGTASEPFTTSVRDRVKTFRRDKKGK